MNDLRGAFGLAFRHLFHHPLRSSLLVIALGLPAFLPLATRKLVAQYRQSLLSRAESTPLLCGAPGSRFDLVLASLEFRGRAPRDLRQAELDELSAEELAVVVPLRVGHATARGLPVVGTTLEYFEKRGFELDSGTFPLWTGDCVLGSAAALQLGLTDQQSIASDVADPHNLAGAYPLDLFVTGILAKTGTADDSALFCNLDTAWILEGLGHGHIPAATAGGDDVLGKKDDVTVFSPAVREHQSLDGERAEQFHFHGEPGDRPLSSVLFFPFASKERTLLKGRLELHESLVLVSPTDVVSEMLDLVLKAKRFFDTNALLVAAAGLLALAVIAGYAWQVRSKEIATLMRLGSSRSFLVSLFGLELLLLMSTALGLALVLAQVAGPVLRNQLLPS